MNLKDRKKRSIRNGVISEASSDAPLTTITNNGQKEKKQSAPTCYRFNDYDKAEIALAVANLKSKAEVTTRVTPAKLLRALVRVNNLGYVNESELINAINSL